MSKEKVKSILLYLAKVAMLSLICFFTFIEPSALILIFFLAPPLYILLYLGIAVLLTKFPKCKDDDRSFFKKHLFPVIALLAGVGVTILLYFGVLECKDIFQTIRINNFAKKSEEIIPYDTATYHMSGMLGTDFMHNVIMIDYDTKTVSFLFGDLIRYKEFRFESGAVNDTSMLQFTAELNSPGKTLTTYYYKGESYSHRTSSIMLTMEDGTVYSVSGLENTDDDWLSLDCQTITIDERKKEYLVDGRSFEEAYNNRK